MKVDFVRSPHGDYGIFRGDEYLGLIHRDKLHGLCGWRVIGDVTSKMRLTDAFNTKLNMLKIQIRRTLAG